VTVAKSFDIPKRLVWEAYKRVKANRGAAGVDNQSIADFDCKRDKNLYQIWNRMTSGSYFPLPVKAVRIPKKSGGTRTPGIPTVSDSYRRGKSAHDAIAVTRLRCWKSNWVLEYDIRGLFDNINRGLLLKALRHHCTDRWVILYVERWLVVPLQEGDCVLSERKIGTPQGGPLSPVLANLFLHYALDNWLSTHHSSIPFCRYADDGILQCKTKPQAVSMQSKLAERLRVCGLELHPEKTRIVYCKDSKRRGTHNHIQFDFLGYSFRPRRIVDGRGRIRSGFTPAVSRSSMTAMRQRARSWRIQLQSSLSIDELAKVIAPRVRSG